MKNRYSGNVGGGWYCLKRGWLGQFADLGGRGRGRAWQERGGGVFEWRG